MNVDKDITKNIPISGCLQLVTAFLSFAVRIMNIQFSVSSAPLFRQLDIGVL